MAEPSVYDLARHVLQKTLDRLNLESGKRCGAAENDHVEVIRQHHAGQAAGLFTAATILQEEINRLPR